MRYREPNLAIGFPQTDSHVYIHESISRACSFECLVGAIVLHENGLALTFNYLTLSARAQKLNSLFPRIPANYQPMTNIPIHSALARRKAAKGDRARHRDNVIRDLVSGHSQIRQASVQLANGLFDGPCDSSCR